MEPPSGNPDVGEAVLGVGFLLARDRAGGWARGVEFGEFEIGEVLVGGSLVAFFEALEGGAVAAAFDEFPGFASEVVTGAGDGDFRGWGGSRLHFGDDEFAGGEAFDVAKGFLAALGADAEVDLFGDGLLEVAEGAGEGDFPAFIGGFAAERFFQGEGKEAAAAVRILPSAFADGGGVEGGERFDALVAEVEAEAVDVAFGEGVGEVGAAAGFIAAGIEDDQDLGDAGGLDAGAEAVDGERGFLEERDVVVEAGIGGEEEWLAAAFDAVAGELEQKETVFGDLAEDVGELDEDVAASGRAVDVGVGGIVRVAVGEDEDLIVAEAGHVDEGFLHRKGIVGGAVKAGDGAVLVFVDADEEGPAFICRSECRYGGSGFQRTLAGGGGGER